MKNLSDLVLDYLCFLEFTEDDDLDPDVAVKELERVSYQIEYAFSESEKASLSESATRRLEKEAVDLKLDHREFLHAIADGNFSGTVDDDDSEDDED